MNPDQHYYDVAGEELKAQQVKPGLWARAVAETDCQGEKARALYIRLRVAELQAADEGTAPQKRPLSKIPFVIAGSIILVVIVLILIGAGYERNRRMEQFERPSVSPDRPAVSISQPVPDMTKENSLVKEFRRQFPDDTTDNSILTLKLGEHWLADPTNAAIMAKIYPDFVAQYRYLMTR